MEPSKELVDKIVDGASARYNSMTHAQKAKVSITAVVFNVMKAYKVSSGMWRDLHSIACSKLGSRGGKSNGRRKKSMSTYQKEIPVKSHTRTKTGKLRIVHQTAMHTRWQAEIGSGQDANLLRDIEYGIAGE